MATPASQFSLDHVVILLPYELLGHPPLWITQNFTVSPGGRHGDGNTENRLILFRDGSYVELIAFINDDAEKRQDHWWDKPFGVVDFAFTTTELDYNGLSRRLQESKTGISYARPKSGGRIAPYTGKELKWEVTFPEGVERGNVPFFCTDVTPRQRRVPITDSNTMHPSGALGMAGMIQEVQKERLELLSSATAAILGLPKESSHRYNVRAPNEVAGLKEPSIRLHAASPGAEGDLALTLILQTGESTRRDPIRESIEDGVVSINFE